MDLVYKLKERLAKTYRAYGDKVMLLSPGVGKCSWTGNEIADEIENETEFGVKQMHKLLNLTIDLVSRDKEKL